MIADVREPQGFGLADQEAEHAATLGKGPYLHPGDVVDANRDESLEAGAIGIEDSQGGITRARQIAGSVQNNR